MIRDKQLDNYRALVMIHMVCVIHVIYWLGIFFPMQSFTLFAMSSVLLIIQVSQVPNLPFLIDRFQ